MPYGITQCYLPTVFTPAETGTRYSYHGGMQDFELTYAL